MPSRELRLPGVRRGKPVRFTCDGEGVEAFEGESVAAALLASGRHALGVSPRRGAPRGLFCVMGACFDCTMTIDGRTGRRACMTPVRAGMAVEVGRWGDAVSGPAPGSGEPDTDPATPVRQLGDPGRPDPATGGVEEARSEPRAIVPDGELFAGPQPSARCPTEVELVVVGAGPGGLSAAVAAARAGTHVLVLDENSRPGGQIYRQMPKSFVEEGDAPHSLIAPTGRDLLDEARAVGVEIRRDTTIWGSFESGILEVVTRDRPERIRPQRLVLSTGAHDRPAPVPGWTLPGVFTVGGAQALLKSQRMIVGRRILLCGVGPLLLVVAAQMAEAGAHVVAVVEPVSPLRAARILPALLRELPLAREGFEYGWSLVKRRVPWRGRSVLTRIEGDGRVERAVVARVDRDWNLLPHTQAYEVDAVCLGYGLVPSIELAAICGCPIRLDPQTRTWVPALGADLRSEAPGVYVVGDGAGISGAQAAVVEGRIAGLSVARELGHLEPARADARLGPLLARRAELNRFARALSRTYRLRPGLLSLAQADTTVCRCEEVSLAEVDRAIAEGADTLGLLKAWTRAGMGWCQGRMCGSFLMERLASRLQRPLEEVGRFGPRIPSKPVISLGSVTRRQPPRGEGPGPPGARSSD